MNIAELAERVAAERGVDKKRAKGVIEAALKAVVEAAKGGAEVNLAGFGKFKVQDRPEREGRNPATGEAVTIAASRKGGGRRPVRFLEAILGGFTASLTDPTCRHVSLLTRQHPDLLECWPVATLARRTAQDRSLPARR